MLVNVCLHYPLCERLDMTVFMMLKMIGFCVVLALDMGPAVICACLEVSSPSTLVDVDG